MGKERRVRIFWLAEEQVWTLFVRRWSLPDAVTLLHLDGVPEDCAVESVCHDWSRRAFGFRLSCPSFDPVPDGGVPPDSAFPLQFESVLVRRGADGQLDAWEALRRENACLRAVFGDICEDSPALRAAFEQGVVEEREACARHVKTYPWLAEDIRLGLHRETAG